MVLGFNHNVNYKGDVFHVQTEDSGVAIPHIITLLYRGGIIICSQKTSYADILKIDNLETVVEELMKEQHKAMMRRLKSGEFDERIFPSDTPSAVIDYEPAPLNGNTLDEMAPIASTALETASDATDRTIQPESQSSQPEPAADESSSGPDIAPMEFTSLDDAILAFFAGNKK